MAERLKTRGSKHNFSPYLSYQRLRDIQKVLKQNEGQKNAAQVILAVLGIDGKFNEGCRELADYLTFDFFSARQVELEKAGLEEEDIEDVIFLIRSESVSIYCGSLLYKFLLPYVAQWKNIQIYSRSQQAKEQDRDTEAEELYKIRSFLAMLKGCTIVGIPYLGSVMIQKENKNAVASIEKWPLMQSYASKDVGCGDSFTLKHTPIDVRDLLLPLYNQCDPFVLEKTITSSLPLFTRHWNEALNVVHNAVKSKNVMQLKEEQVLEPLHCYHKHGQLSKGTKKGNMSDPSKKPFVLFGTHSLDLEKKSSSIVLKAGARKGKAAPNHMVMQCISPNGPILCTRTYFFRSPGKVGSSEKEFGGLVHLYTLCIQGVSLAINEFCSALSGAKAERKAIEHLLSKGMSGGLVFDAKCSINSCDKLGKKIQVSEEKSSASLNIIKVSAENIKTSHGGDPIGSVMYSDTFVASSFKLLDGEPSTVCNVLTSDIPSYFEWPTEFVKSVGNFSEDPLAFCKDMMICSSSDLYSPPCTASIQFNHDGTMLLSAKNMEEIVLKDGVQYYDTDSPGKICLLIVSFDFPENSPSWGHVPAHFRGEVNIVPDLALSQSSKCLVLALIPGTKAYKEFYAVVAHNIQNDPLTKLRLKKMKQLSLDLNNLFNSIQNVHENRLNVTKDTFKSALPSQICPTLRDFMTHITISSIAGDFPVPAKTIESLIKKKMLNEEILEDEKICVTIVSGLPCSGADKISQQLISLNKEKVRWVVIHPTTASDYTLDKGNLEEQLAQAVAHKRVARPSAAARKKLRVIILTLGFFDVNEVVQCVTHHTDASIREQLSLGAVTLCIWPDSLFYAERQNYPRFFDQCLPGIISNFAFVVPEQERTGSMDESLSAAQSLLRGVNKQAAFLICPGGKLIRKSDFELVLAEDTFSSMKMMQERFLLRPALSTGRYTPGMCFPAISKVKLEFSQPLIKGTFSARLRGLKSSIVRPHFFGSVAFVTGSVGFTESPKQDYDVTFSSAMPEVELTAQIVQTTFPTPPSKGGRSKSKPYSLEFHGVDLNEEALKDWLRKCGRQKPSKKCHKTRNHLTKDEMRTIHEDNCTRHLPEGYFYNGSFYVSLYNNEKMIHHPYMQKFVDEYLAAENEEIDEYNAEIDRQNIKDLFE